MKTERDYYEEFDNTRCLKFHFQDIPFLREKRKKIFTAATRFRSMRELTIFGIKYNHLFDYVLDVLQDIDTYKIGLNLQSIMRTDSLKKIFEIEEKWSKLSLVLGAFYQHHKTNTLESVYTYNWDPEYNHKDDIVRRKINKSSAWQDPIQMSNFKEREVAEIFCFRLLFAINRIIISNVYSEFRQALDMSRNLPIKPGSRGFFILLSKKCFEVKFDDKTKTFTLIQKERRINKSFLRP